MDLGEKIRSARQKSGLTQSALAARIGLSPQRISQYESNYRRPRPDMLARIAQEIGVPISYFREDEYLSSADAYVFLQNARKYIEEACLNTDPADLHDSGFDTYFRFNEDYYRPTKSDVKAFADDTGLSIDYLLGLATEEECEAGIPGGSKLLSVPGYDQVDIGIIISHILRFFHNDLHVSECTVTDAEVIAEVLMRYLKVENLVPLSWLVSGVSSEIREAALAVLNTGGQWQEDARKQFEKLDIYHDALQAGVYIRKILLADAGKEVFLVSSSDDNKEHYSATVFNTLENAREYVESKCKEKNSEKAKTPQDHKDPET